jgi:outer membrane protein TolC
MFLQSILRADRIAFTKIVHVLFHLRLSTVLKVLLVVAFIPASSHSFARAQEKPEAPAPQPTANTTAAASDAKDNRDNPVQLSLSSALALARKNSTVYNAALVEAGSAGIDRALARDALLPQVNFNNEYLYTQSNQHGGVRFIANNAVHEYTSQGNAHESIDLAGLANYRKVSAAAALARAKAEIASRGLVVTVAQNYFNALSAQFKLEDARRAADEGNRFLELTQQLEHGGEVAHADTIKAELQAQDRRRQFQEAQLAVLNTRLDLAVLIFPNLQDNFVLTDDLRATAPLPSLEEVQQQAARDNPDLRAALESLHISSSEVAAARAGYLPALNLDYFYGIDAPNFATHSLFQGNRLDNLGSSALATLNIPVWNWGATRDRIRQAQLHQKQAKLELSYSQRKLIAEIQSLHAEAETALNELTGLARSAELAAESQRLTSLRYKDGEATVLEVVDSQTAYVQASNNYHDGAVRYRVALANLQTLTGVLTTP